MGSRQWPPAEANADEQWVSGGGNKIIDFPVTIKGIAVGMSRTKLDLLDFKASAASIGLKDAGGIYR